MHPPSYCLLFFAVAIAIITPSCVTPGATTPATSRTDGAIDLHSPALERKWQARDSDGMIRYVDPASSLQFLAIRKLNGPGPSLAEAPLITPLGYGDPGSNSKKKPYKQSWKSSIIAGQKVRWYQQDEGSGADFPGFSTEPFAITTRTGQIEYYEILVCSGMQGDYLRDIDQMLSSVQLR